MQTLTALTGRILLGFIFIWAGFMKLTHPEAHVTYMTLYKIPMANILIYVAGIVELAGALSIISGFKARWGAVLLFLFMIPATLVFHTPLVVPFADDMHARMQWIHLTKNLAVMGGLLLLAAFGPGSASVKKAK